MAIIKSASARYESFGKDGKGFVSTQSEVLNNQPYGFNTRFEDQKGTNPEELIAAAHASCYTMALSFALEKEGYKDGQLETSAHVHLEKDGEGFKVSRSELQLKAKVKGIDEVAFTKFAEDAKINCPISKMINAQISLQHEFTQL